LASYFCIRQRSDLNVFKSRYMPPAAKGRIYKARFRAGFIRRRTLCPFDFHKEICQFVSNPGKKFFWKKFVFKKNFTLRLREPKTAKVTSLSPGRGNLEINEQNCKLIHITYILNKKYSIISLLNKNQPESSVVVKYLSIEVNTNISFHVFWTVVKNLKMFINVLIFYLCLFIYL